MDGDLGGGGSWGDDNLSGWSVSEDLSQCTCLPLPLPAHNQDCDGPSGEVKVQLTRSRASPPRGKNPGPLSKEASIPTQPFLSQLPGVSQRTQLASDDDIRETPVSNRFSLSCTNVPR